MTPTISPPPSWPNFQPAMMPEAPDVFTPSEIKLHAVHAGHSLDLKSYQTDSALLVLKLSSHQKTWLPATELTSVATVETSQLNSNTSRRLVLLLTHASHTPHSMEVNQNVLPHAQMDQNSLNTSALQVQLLPLVRSWPTRKPKVPKKSNLKSSPTVQSKPDSTYMLTS